MHASYVIDNAKKAVEALCPSIVSCTYTSAFAAIDALRGLSIEDLMALSGEYDKAPNLTWSTPSLESRSFFPIAHHAINGYTASIPPMTLTLHYTQPLQHS
ncbi:hypothetical protein H5410_006127 [Solanum commersonii]|uniref:Uncharacterized protein n=1 Tax=Solanum commersonii TaxID=4109 RepID=A0A9J6A8H0_SOLCO|nr:hypothetical protein H5410_006127 [Solanum commersonii]